MSRYAKAVSALLTALVAWGYSVAPHGITTKEWFGLALVLNAAVVVFAVPNTPPPGEPARPDVSETDPLVTVEPKRPRRKP